MKRLVHDSKNFGSSYAQVSCHSLLKANQAALPTDPQQRAPFRVTLLAIMRGDGAAHYLGGNSQANLSGLRSA